MVRMVLFIAGALLVLPAVIALWGLSRCWQAIKKCATRKREG